MSLKIITFALKPNDLNTFRAKGTFSKGTSYILAELETIIVSLLPSKPFFE